MGEKNIYDNIGHNEKKPKFGTYSAVRNISRSIFPAIVYNQLPRQSQTTIYINIYLSVTTQNPLCGSLSHLYLQDN